MRAQLKKVQDGFSETMDRMTNPDNLSGGLVRGVYPIYQKYQTKRFMTENRSEGKAWDPLNDRYRSAKEKKFKSFPGSGNKLMVATSTLAGAVIGKGQHSFNGTEKHRMIANKTSLQIYVEESGNNAAGKKFNYASSAAEKRPVMEFTEEHLEEMKQALAKYLLNSK